MEFRLRDTRHLKGTTPRVQAEPPETPGHCVDSGWREGRPYLTIRDDAGVLHDVELEDTLDLEVLDQRHCVGRHVDGQWVACPHDAVADHFDQCPACHPLPSRDCVFNPTCHDCTEPLCRSPHRLYLAFYGELPKVGMTRSTRGDARLTEQGADAFAILTSVPDRAEARRLEDLVTRRLGIPQARRAEELLTRCARRTPWSAIEQAYDALRPKLGDLLGAAPGPLQRAEGHSGSFPLPTVPTLAGVVGHHAGRILGTKGRYLFYRAAGVEAGREDLEPVWALNLNALTTHRVRFTAK